MNIYSCLVHVTGSQHRWNRNKLVVNSAASVPREQLAPRDTTMNRAYSISIMFHICASNSSTCQDRRNVIVLWFRITGGSYVTMKPYHSVFGRENFAAAYQWGDVRKRLWPFTTEGTSVSTLIVNVEKTAALV
jgi:hypothetical protein